MALREEIVTEPYLVVSNQTGSVADDLEVIPVLAASNVTLSNHTVSTGADEDLATDGSKSSVSPKLNVENHQEVSDDQSGKKTEGHENTSEEHEADKTSQTYDTDIASDEHSTDITSEEPTDDISSDVHKLQPAAANSLTLKSINISDNITRQSTNLTVDSLSHNVTAGNISFTESDAKLDIINTISLPSTVTLPKAVNSNSDSDVSMAVTSNETAVIDNQMTSRNITSGDYDPEEATNVINEDADYRDYYYDYDDDYYYDDRDSNRTPKGYDADDEADSDYYDNDTGDNDDKDGDMFYRQDDFTRYENDNFTDYDYNYTLEGKLSVSSYIACMICISQRAK